MTSFLIPPCRPLVKLPRLASSNPYRQIISLTEVSSKLFQLFASIQFIFVLSVSWSRRIEHLRSHATTPVSKRCTFIDRTATSPFKLLDIRDIKYRPPGTQINLLNDVTLTLPKKSFGMIFGRSGSGKTTLLQLIAGLTKPTSGSIYIQGYSDEGTPNQPPVLLSPERVGIVFQFPERYFVADNVFDEITFGLPRQKTDLTTKQLIATRLERAITSVGLNGISLDKNPNSLSGGYKRRLALAIQLVQIPELLVLDEPLAGLDWKARADVVKLLTDLKKELTILVVSHDLKELAPLVDKSWRMDVGGVLMEERLPI
ncbi:hypothetical protein LXL04_023790 [Taraxacum kok-saghyz]